MPPTFCFIVGNLTPPAMGWNVLAAGLARMPFSIPNGDAFIPGHRGRKTQIEITQIDGEYLV